MMLKWLASLFLCVGVMLLVESAAQAQDQNGVPLLQVYLDCDRDDCDDDHIRTEIPWVDYVRDRELADVHVFVTTTNTVLSGERYELSFIGRGVHEAMQYILDRTIDPAATNEEKREIVNDAIRVGLAPYVTQLTPSAITVGYDESIVRTEEEALERDPWRHWVFTLYGGDFEIEEESHRSILDTRWGFYADHRSEQWKVRIRPYFNFDRINVRRDSLEDYRSSVSRHGLDTFVIRSLGPHWSAAVFADYITRNDQNLKHQGWVASGLEYSFLPYEEATRRAVTLTYLLGMTYSEYFEVTIFDATTEWLPRHEVEFSVMLRRPWGDVYGGVELDQYLHDTSVLRVEVGGYISVRVFEGFSLQANVGYDAIRDQIALPKGEASLADILLQQRELATDYSFSSSIAFTYTFGSRFANVVNTRF